MRYFFDSNFPGPKPPPMVGATKAFADALTGYSDHIRPHRQPRSGLAVLRRNDCTLTRYRPHRTGPTWP